MKEIKQWLCLTVLLLTSAMPGLAQTAYKGQLFISQEQLSIQGTLLRVQLNISYDVTLLNPGETLHFTPVIKDSQNQVALSSVVITGKSAQQRQRGNIAVARRGQLHGTRYFDYDTTIPYQPWMAGASLYAECEELATNGKKHLYEDRLIERLSISGASQAHKSTTTTVPQRSCPPATWLQFLKPTVNQTRQQTVSGCIPLTDERKIGRLSTRKFNKVVAEDIQQRLSSLLDAEGTRLASLDIRGYGAPIGNYRRNEVRSTARAVDLKAALVQSPLGTGALSVTWQTEDWDSIARLIAAGNLTLSRAATDIIRAVDVTAGREDQLRMLGGGSLYRQLRTDVFPQVCRLEYTAVVETDNHDTASGWLSLDGERSAMSMADLYAVASRFSRDSKEFGDMMETIVRLYPDNTEARINAAAVALLRSQTDRAARLLEGLETEPRAYHNIGVLHLMRGDRSKAEVYLRMARAAGVAESSTVLSSLK